MSNKTLSATHVQGCVCVEIHCGLDNRRGQSSEFDKFLLKLYNQWQVSEGQSERFNDVTDRHSDNGQEIRGMEVFKTGDLKPD